MYRWNKLWNKFKLNKAPYLVGLPQKFILDLILRLSKQGSFKALVAKPEGVSNQGAQANDFLGKRPLWDDRKVRLAPKLLMTEAKKLDQVFSNELEQKQSQQLRLISKRVHSTHNSWTQNITELTQSKKHQTNYLYMHPDDAANLGLVEDKLVDVESKAGQVRLPLKFSKDLKQGAVAMQHGWGHQHAVGLSVASKLQGVNVNLLASDGPTEIESVSGMAHLSGIPVSVSPARGKVNPQSWSGLG